MSKLDNIRLYAFTDEAGVEIDSQIAAAKRNGLYGIELRGSEFGNVSDLSFVAACCISKKLKDAGLSVWSLGSPLGKIGIEDEFTPHLEKLRNTLELCRVFGTKNIRMFSFYIPRGKNPDDYKNKVIDRLGRMLEMSKSYGVTLCHENEKGIYGEDALRCLEIIKALPDIKAVFDPANFIQCGVDTLSAWELLKPYVKYMHIKDALSNGRVVPAGKGEGNVKSIALEFIRAGGSDFTIEPHLAVFKGLSSLEREGERSGVGEEYTYPDSDAAFDTACGSFKELLREDS